MRFNMLQLVKNLRFRSQGKEFTDADILNWANKKVKITGRTSHMDSFKNLSNGLFFLELLSAVVPRVVSWNLVTKGESDEEKKSNATYIISVARKLGCSIFLLPKDIMMIAKLQDDNKALDHFTKSKEAALLEAEQSVQVVLAKASMVDDLQNKNQDLMKQIEICQEERKTLDRELARAKVTANRVAAVVANEWKDAN